MCISSNKYSDRNYKTDFKKNLNTDKPDHEGIDTDGLFRIIDEVKICNGISDVEILSNEDVINKLRSLKQFSDPTLHKKIVDGDDRIFIIPYFK